MFALLFSLLPSLAFAEEPNIDLGTFAVTNPRIGVTYTRDVKVDFATLAYLGQSERVYTLCIKPDPTLYHTTYDLLAVQGGTQGECEEDPSLMQTGDYLLTISAFDANTLPSQAAPPDQRRFSLTGMEIFMISPSFGVGRTNPVPVHLYTHEKVGTTDYARAAECKWTSDKDMYHIGKYDLITNTATSGDNKNHRLDFPGRGTLYVLCKEASSGRITPGEFKIDYDMTPPSYSDINVTPNPVNDPGKKYAGVNFKTDDLAACTIQQIKPTTGTATPFPRDNSKDATPIGPSTEDPANEKGYVTNHETVIEFATVNDEIERNFSYKLECRNLAGILSTKLVNVTVKLNGLIEVISPGLIINKSQFPLTIRPSFDPTGCTANNEPLTVDESDDLIYSKSYTKNDGKYTFNLRCTTTGKQATATHIVTVDSTKPSTPTIDAKSAICAGVVSAKLQATDPRSKNAPTAVPTGIVHYNYTVTDGADFTYNGRTTTGVAEVTLVEGVGNSLTWTAFAVDGAENEGEQNTTTVEIHPGEDEECGEPAFITLLSPLPIGFSNSQQTEYKFSVSTELESACGYRVEQTAGWSVQLPFTKTGNLVHDKTVSFTSQRVMVNCTENEEEITHKRIFNIGRDPTKPVIAITVKPSATIVDPALALVTVTINTDDPSYCVIDDEPLDELPDTDPRAYKTSSTKILDYTTASNGAKSFVVDCKNLAQLTATKTQNIIVNFNAKFNITMLSPLSTTSADEITLSVQPNKLAECDYKENATAEPEAFTTIEDGIHSASLGNLPEGSHSFIISCTAVSDGATAGAIAQFTVDRSAPVVTDITGATSVCPNTTSAYTVEVTSISPYSLEYSLDGPGGVTFQGNSSSDVFTMPELAMATGSYTLTVIAIKNGGVRSQPLSISVELLPKDAVACDLSSDHCDNKIKDTGEENIDCGGTCSRTCVVCTTSLDCDFPDVCSQGICQEPPADCDELVVDSETSECPDGLVCIDGSCLLEELPCVTDDDCSIGQVCIAEVCVNAGAKCSDDEPCSFGQTCASGTCTSDDDPCANGIKDSGEDDVDCGGTCDQCAICSDSAPCDDGICSENGYCIPEPRASCADSIKNGDETGIDCGGRCGICTSTGCETDAQCTVGSCINGRCTTPQPTACTDDMVCSAGELCVDGICTVAPASEEASHLLSILLVVLGMAIMGGAGYFLYEQNEEKTRIRALQAQQQQMMQQSSQRRGPVMPREAMTDPALAAKMAQESAARQAALKQAYDARLAEKDAQRKAMFKGFGDAQSESPTMPTAEPAKGVSPGAILKSDKKDGKDSGKNDAEDSEKEDDGYLDITQIGKRKADAQKTGKDAGKKDDAGKNDAATKKDDKNVKAESKSDVFDALGKIGR